MATFHFDLPDDLQKKLERANALDRKYTRDMIRRVAEDIEKKILRDEEPTVDNDTFNRIDRLRKIRDGNSQRAAEEMEKKILRGTKEIAEMDKVHETLTGADPYSGPHISGRLVYFDQIPKQIQERYADRERVSSIRFYFTENREFYYVRFHNDQRFVHKWSKSGRNWACRVIDISENEVKQ